MNKAHAEIKKAGDLYTWINKKEAERQEYKKEKNPYKTQVQKGWEYLDPSACLALKTLGEDERSKLIDNLNGNQKKAMSYALGLRSVESIDCNLAENLKKFFAGDGELFSCASLLSCSSSLLLALSSFFFLASS